MLAKVINITEKPTTKGGIYYNLSLDVDGKKITINSFNAADNATFKQAKESGAWLEVVTSKNDKGYDQIDSVNFTGIPETKPKQTVPEMPPYEQKTDSGHSSRTDTTNDSIQRQVSLKCACETLPNASTVDILIRSLDFYEWLSQGQMPESIPDAPQSTTAQPKPPTPVSTPPVVKDTPMNAMTHEAIKLLAADPDKLGIMKATAKDKGWTKGKTDFTLKDLTQFQAVTLLNMFSE